MRVPYLEKFALAALVCAWLVYGSNWLGKTLVHVNTTAPIVAMHEPEVAADAEAAAAVSVDFHTLLNEASVDKGEKVFGKCKSCHTTEKGGKAGVGPNLWGIVEGPMAHEGDFTYSEAIAAKAAAGEKWTYDNLNEWLTNPKNFAKGTKMSFAGLSKAEDRAAVILFLRAQGDTQSPLPPPSPVKAAAPAAAKAAAPAAATPAPAAAAPAPVDFKTLLENASAADGQKVFGKCKSCHTTEQGGKAGVGPNLWNIVGGPMAHESDFSYSAGLTAMAEAGDKWTYDHLDAWLANPKNFVKGTKMSFAGLSKPEDRAAVIIFLRSNSDNPPPLP